MKTAERKPAPEPQSVLSAEAQANQRAYWRGIAKYGAIDLVPDYPAPPNGYSRTRGA